MNSNFGENNGIFGILISIALSKTLYCFTDTNKGFVIDTMKFIDHNAQNASERRHQIHALSFYYLSYIRQKAAQEPNRR